MHTVPWDIVCEGESMVLEQLLAVAGVAHIWKDQEVEEGNLGTRGFFPSSPTLFPTHPSGRCSYIHDASPLLI